MLKGILRLEYQYIAFQGVQHDFRGVADQCTGQSGPRHGAQYGYHGLDLAGYMGDQYVCRAFGDVQLAIAERVLLLEALAAFAVAAFDGVLELEGRIGCREHGRGVRAYHVQLAFWPCRPCRCSG